MTKFYINQIVVSVIEPYYNHLLLNKKLIIVIVPDKGSIILAMGYMMAFVVSDI